MITEQLIKLSYLFYPIKIDSSKNYREYLETNENKRLSDFKNFVVESKFETIFIERILIDLKKIQLFEKVDNTTSINLDRCFTLSNKLYEGKNTLRQIIIRISILAPIYTIYIITNKINSSDNSWLTIPELIKQKDSVLVGEIELIKSSIENQINFTFVEFDKLKKVIPFVSYADIKFGEFTIFNAFFSNNLY